MTWRRPSPLIADLGESTAFYHVHSYVPVPADEDIVLGTGEYGAPFVSFVGRDRIFGAQCHPEKSSTAGLTLLRNFVNIATRTPVA